MWPGRQNVCALFVLQHLRELDLCTRQTVNLKKIPVKMQSVQKINTTRGQ